MNDINHIRGAIHLHTNLSHDGILSLEQLVEFLKLRKYQFMAITEHSYDVDDSSMKDLARRSAQLSSPEFIIIPGIEFRCHDDIDILGFGVIQVCNSNDPAAIIRHIHDNGGVAVLAHPTVRNYPIESNWVRLLDGCEIWNRQEGKYFPQTRTIRKFIQLRKWHPDLTAYCGLDLHGPANFYPITIDISASNNAREDILRALREGKYVSESPLIKINSKGTINIFILLLIYSCNLILNLIRSIREVISK